jgi:PleD family two-component response regulator
LASEVNHKSLETVTERLRMLIEQSYLGIDDHSSGVTLSIGATLVTPTDTPETLIQRADELMYASKANGCNQATIGYTLIVVEQTVGL